MTTRPRAGNRSRLALCAVVFAVVGAAACDCPRTRCITPPAVVFDVRGSADAGLATAEVSGGAPNGSVVRVEAADCYASPCTHHYFEKDGEGARTFRVAATGYQTAEQEVVLHRTEDGCGIVPQRVELELVPVGDASSVAKSVQSLAAACGG